MLLSHVFLYTARDNTAVSTPGTWHTKYRIILQQYSIELSIPRKLTLESEVSILWYRYRPSLIKASGNHRSAAKGQKSISSKVKKVSESKSEVSPKKKLARPVLIHELSYRLQVSTRVRTPCNGARTPCKGACMKLWRNVINPERTLKKPPK